MKSKKVKTFIGVLIAAIMCTAVASVLSYTKLGVANPFKAVNGLAKVVFTDAQYVEIQQHPKIIIAKPDTSLDAYMEEQGYERNPEKQMGALFVFTTGGFEELIMYEENRFFSKWSWQE